MKTLFLSAILFLTLITTQSYSQETEQKKGVEIPVGMESIKAGNAVIIVPKGTRVNDTGGLIALESINEYSARKFMEIEDRLSKIEAEQEELKKKIQGFTNK